MVDVSTMPENSFGYVPTPALVAPIEFTLRREDYSAMGGHMDAVRRIEDIVDDIDGRIKALRWHEHAPWPGAPL